MTTWVYEVHVVGRLSDGVLTQIHDQVGEVSTTTEPVCTLIRGSVPDQSALVGLLDQLHALGLKVLELRRLVDPETEPDGEIVRFPGPGSDRLVT